MPLNNPRPGYNSVPEYQMSGLPWVLSGSASASFALDFPFVTRAINFINNSSAGTFLKIGFTQNGVNGSNCYLLNGGQQLRAEVRVREVWLASQTAAVNYCVLAELTTIEPLHVLPLTGSVSSSVDWINYPGLG